jgi:hypothetical protein
MEKHVDKFSVFWGLTITVTIVLPALFAVWPISTGIEMLAFDTKLIIIIPIAYWMKTLIKKQNPSISSSLWLALAILAMCFAAYFLRSENLVMHPQFNPHTPWERLQQYAAFCAFGYAGLCVIFSAIVLWGRHHK